MKPILCVDFDGVIHSYTSGWQGPLLIADPVTPGFFEWLDEAAQYFKIVIYSSRSKHLGGPDAMAAWLEEQRSVAAGKSPLPVEFAHEKPTAFLTLDDRCICFDGHWPDPQVMLQFKPWNK